MITNRLAAIDFSPPYVLSGSSDKHMKLMDLSSGLGWCTSPEPDPEGNTDPAPILSRQPCAACGGTPPLPKAPAHQPTHSDLVRSVALNDSFVVSGSYDHTVKVTSSASCQFPVLPNPTWFFTRFGSVPLVNCWQT
jgi:hypothetical protein